MPRRRISRKRTRSRENSQNRSIEENNEGSNSTRAQHIPGTAKRRRESSLTSNNSPYNLRPRRSTTTETQSVETSSTNERTFSTVAPARQYRLLYISDDEDQTTTSNIAARPRSSRSASNGTNQNRSRTTTESTPSSSTTDENSDIFNPGVAHVRLNRAIEIVIDSIQSLEGVASNFDQLVFGLIYGRFNTRTEYDGLEGMIRLSRILNYNLSARLSQTEIDALPKIKFQNQNDSSLSSALLVEKCPICLTEFSDDEIINKLYCTHLFHQQCISTWLSENDSCPTCRRKVNAG